MFQDVFPFPIYCLQGEFEKFKRQLMAKMND